MYININFRFLPVSENLFLNELIIQSQLGAELDYTVELQTNNAPSTR